MGECSNSSGLLSSGVAVANHMYVSSVGIESVYANTIGVSAYIMLETSKSCG